METVAHCDTCGSEVSMWLHKNEALHHQHTTAYGKPTGPGQWWVTARVS